MQSRFRRLQKRILVKLKKERDRKETLDFNKKTFKTPEETKEFIKAGKVMQKKT